jgi:hypothetical protein
MVTRAPHGETAETRQPSRSRRGGRFSARTRSPTACSSRRANRIGVEDELQFWGRSFVADPTGQVIAEASGRRSLRCLIADDRRRSPIEQPAAGLAVLAGSADRRIRVDHGEVPR